MEVVLYGRTSYVNDNILTFLRFSRNDDYSICLDYCNSSNFEQIIKAPHYALPSYVVFYHNLYGSTHFCGSHFLYLLYSSFIILSNDIYLSSISIDGSELIFGILLENSLASFIFLCVSSSFCFAISSCNAVIYS